MSHQQYQNCIDACYACAVACSHCASECLKEENVRELRRCIQLDLECASICKSSADIMSFGSNFSGNICRVCADICQTCADECEKHAEMGMNHCRDCAQACRKCAQACEEMSAAA